MHHDLHMVQNYDGPEKKKAYRNPPSRDLHTFDESTTNKDQASSMFRELKHQSVLLQLQILKLPTENLWKNVPGTYRQEQLSKN